MYKSSGKRPCVLLECETCHTQFWRDKRSISRRKTEGHAYCSRKCSRNRVNVVCTTCGIEFEKKNSSLINSKSGMYFCSNICKNKAQRIDSGINYKLPSHYGTSDINYRDKALRYYDNKCRICTYDEYPEILHVHHIDHNHMNNDLSNLIILCPNCHAKVHRNIIHI